MLDRDDMNERDYTAEIRAALYRAHGLRAWEIAIESGRPDLLAYVEQHTGGLRVKPWRHLGTPITGHVFTLCGVAVGRVEHGTEAAVSRAGKLTQRHNVHVYRFGISDHWADALERWLGGLTTVVDVDERTYAGTIVNGDVAYMSRARWPA